MRWAGRERLLFTTETPWIYAPGEMVSTRQVTRIVALPPTLQPDGHYKPRARIYGRKAKGPLLGEAHDNDLGLPGFTPELFYTSRERF